MTAKVPFTHPRAAQAFCEGVVSQKTGGQVGDNPHTANSRNFVAWRSGFYAAQGPAAWAYATAYAVGQMVTNQGNLYICTKAGTSAVDDEDPETIDGPTGIGNSITDGTVTWYYGGPAVSGFNLAMCSYPSADSPYSLIRQPW